MSSNGGINISGIDFTKLPDEFNLGGVEDILHSSTAKKLETVNINDEKKITLEDGLDKDETKYIIESINIDDNEEEISNEEINKFLKETLKIENPAEIQMQDINILIQNITDAATKAGAAETDETDTDTEETAETENTTDTTEKSEENNTDGFQVNIQSWGSAAQDGNKYANDCLDHIMKNYYQELTPYSEEWYTKETEIMNANPDIYGDENGTGGRPHINDGARRNAVIHDGDVITLPGITSQTDKIDETTESGSEEMDTVVQSALAQIPEDVQELNEREQIDEENGIEIATYMDAEGNIVGKRQFNGDNIMWESTIAHNEDGTTIETRSWADSGNVQLINYDSEGKEISTNTVQQDGITSEAIYSYDDNGIKSAAVTYSQDGNTIGTGTQEFSEDGSYVEHVEYTVGENNGRAIDTTYTKAGVISSKTMEHTCGEEADSGVKVTYENGLPLQTVYYDTNHEAIGTIDYKYDMENNTHTEVATDLQNNQIAVVKYNLEGEEIDRCSFTPDENGNPVGEIEGNADLLVEIGEPASQNEDQDEDDGSEEDTRTVSKTDFINGGATRTVTYDNGDVEYFHRNGDGTFNDKPSELYAADGTHTVMHYDDNGNKTDENLYNSENKLQHSSEYTYNEDGTYDLTETEYYEDGITIKSKTTTMADGTVTTEEYDKNGNQVSIEGDNELNLSQSASSLESTPLTDAQIEALNNGEEIVSGDYILQKSGDIIRTIQKTEIEINGILTEAKVVLKEENPQDGTVKIYELNNGERRIKTEKTTDSDIINYQYSTGTAGLVYNPDKKAIVESDEKITVQTATKVDKDGNEISKEIYNYTDDKTKSPISKTTSDGITTRATLINAYTDALKDENLQPSEKGDMLLKLLDEENITCTDLSEVLKNINKEKSKEEKISFSDIINNGYGNLTEYFNKIQTIISKSNKKEVSTFLDTYKENSANELSLMRDIQEKLSWGNETETLKSMISALTKDLEIDYDNDHIKALVLDNNLKVAANVDKLSKIYDMLNSNPAKITGEEALSLLYYISDGKPEKLITFLRQQNIAFTISDENQEKYVQMFEELIQEAIK